MSVSPRGVIKLLIHSIIYSSINSFIQQSAHLTWINILQIMKFYTQTDRCIYMYITLNHERIYLTLFIHHIISYYYYFFEYMYVARYYIYPIARLFSTICYQSTQDDASPVEPLHTSDHSIRISCHDHLTVDMTSVWSTKVHFKYCKRANIRGGLNFAMFAVDNFSAKLKPPRSLYNASVYSYLLVDVRSYTIIREIKTTAKGPIHKTANF